MYMRQFLVIPLFIAVLGTTTALPAFGQDTASTTDRTVTRVERGFDWGWLGLLGLAGLLGLRQRHDRTDYTTRPKV